VPLAKLAKRGLSAGIKIWNAFAAALEAGRGARYREVDTGAEAVRRRRSTANRVLTILKAALNHTPRAGARARGTMRAFREADAARLRYLSDDEARRRPMPARFRLSERALDRLPLWRSLPR
jgi:hypothetical protein